MSVEGVARSQDKQRQDLKEGPRPFTVLPESIMLPSVKLSAVVVLTVEEVVVVVTLRG